MSDAIQTIKDVFLAPCDEAGRAKLLAMPEARIRYLIAFTPRSGSSYLCDVLKKTKRFGCPDELISADFLGEIRRNVAPSVSPDEYVDLVLRATCSRNGVAGFKASWFQFENFEQAMDSAQTLAEFKFIYLTRRDMVAQAVSLYRATATGVFHTNVSHEECAVAALRDLPYDRDQIEEWYRHIDAQEKGWGHYFSKHNIFPLVITYEEINEDVAAVARRIACYLGRPRAASDVVSDSVFRKLRQRQSVEWGCRFMLERGE